MAERINKLILETEFKVTGDLTPTTQQISNLQKATKEAQGDTLKLVEAEKKLEQAAAQAGVQVETETRKQSELNKTVKQTANTMKEVATGVKLKDAFDVGNSPQNVQKLLKEFEKSARAAQSVEELENAVQGLLDQLPSDVRAEVFEMLQKETQKLEKSLGNPVSRLRELKKLIATTDDPVLLKKLNEEAATLTDTLGDNQDLVNALASDTFFSDTFVEGARLATGAFSALQGATALLAEDDEELAKAAAKAQAALALLAGTQEILTNLTKSDNIVVRAQVVAQKLYAAAVGESTGAMKGFRVALLATGIGALVIAVGLLAANWDKVKNALSGTTEEQRKYNELQKKIDEATASEAASLDIKLRTLQNSNISEKERVAIIQELQQEYPEYLGNINAETASYDQVAAAVLRVKEALRQKAEVQVLTDELTDLQTQLRTLQREGANASTGFIDSIKSLVIGAAAAGPNISDAFDIADAVLEGNYQKTVKTTEERINELLDLIATKSQGLIITPKFENAKPPKDGKTVATALEGTIAFLQQRVNQLNDQIVNKLKIGTDAYVNTIDELIAAQKQLDEARKTLGGYQPELQFAEGSLNALRKQASDIQEVINNLPEGQELLSQVAKLKAVQEQIDKLQAIINGPQSQEEKRASLLDLLNQEESYQLQSLSILEKGEGEKLRTQIKFAEERLAILRASGADEFTIIQAQDALDLLLLQYEKFNEKLKEENKITTQEIVDGFVMVISEAVRAAQAFLSIEEEKNARLIELQNERVNAAREVADKGNAELLQAEQERLDALNQKQADFARKQIEISTAQLAAESALAIARAAAQGGALAPFTIAATLIALASGLAQAKSQAEAVGQQYSFRKGGYYDGGFTGAGDPGQVSTNLGKRPYEYHKGEYIMDAPFVAIGNNRKWLDNLRLNRVDIDKMFKSNQPTVIINQDSKGIEKAIERIPSTSVSIDRHGIFAITESIGASNKRRNSLKRRR